MVLHSLDNSWHGEDLVAARAKMRRDLQERSNDVSEILGEMRRDTRVISTNYFFI